MRSIPLGFALLVAAASGVAHAGPIAVDEAIPTYSKVGGVAGNLNSIGSDTLNNLMTLWAEGFQKLYPNVRTQIEGKGSSTAPPALIAATGQLGPMSRAMKPTEIDEFEKKFGYAPTKIRVAVDALAIYVNKDNPLDKLTIPEIDAIFSKTRHCGSPKSIDSWGDAGAPGDWSTKPISLYGRNSASGTYGYFKKRALCKGDYRPTVKEQPGSASVVQGVAEDVLGVGYSGIGYQTSDVKALDIAKQSGGEYIDTKPESVLAGRYPLARFLYLYINKKPNQPIDPLVGEFVRYVLSREGQEVAVKDGYLPLSAKIAQSELSQLQ